MARIPIRRQRNLAGQQEPVPTPLPPEPVVVAPDPLPLTWVQGKEDRSSGV